MSHARGVDRPVLFLLEAADAVDDTQRDFCILHPHIHGVVLVALLGSSAGMRIEDVGSVGNNTPFVIGRCPSQRSVEHEHGSDVIHALDGTGLEKWVEHQRQIVPSEQSCRHVSAQDDREMPAVKWQVKEMLALVVSIQSCHSHVTIQPITGTELHR